MATSKVTDYIEDCQNLVLLSVSKHICQIATINENAQSYHRTVNMNERELEQPPAVKHLSDYAMEIILKTSSEIERPCHNQHVERHVKLITDASLHVCGAVDSFVIIDLFHRI